MTNSKEKNFISIVVYVHNSEKTIENFIKCICRHLCENFEKYEIICVDDKSTDGSVEIIKRCAGEIADTTINVIHMSYYQGIESAMNAGVDLAIGDFVYEFDSSNIDFKLDVIKEIYDESLKGYDIVSAKANIKNRLTSKIFYNIFNKNANCFYPISTESFRILSRRAINRVKSLNITIPYRKAVYANCGLKLKSITYNITNKNEINHIKQNSGERIDLAVDAIILFTDVTYKIAIGMSIFMILSTLAIGGYTIYMFLARKAIVGWTTTMLLLSFAFCGIFVLLAIMIKYLSIIVDLIFKKHNYLIESIERVK